MKEESKMVRKTQKPKGSLLAVRPTRMPPTYPTAAQINQVLSQPLPGRYVEGPKQGGKVRGKKR